MRIILERKVEIFWYYDSNRLVLSTLKYLRTSSNNWINHFREI